MAIIHANDENFYQEIQGSKPILVDFYADWCGPCRRIAPILESIDNDRTDVKIIKVDVDKAEAVSRDFGIMSIPVLMVFKDGKVRSQKLGLCSKEDILEMIDV